MLRGGSRVHGRIIDNDVPVVTFFTRIFVFNFKFLDMRV